MSLNKYLKYLGGLVALLLVFGSGWFMRDLGARSDLENVLKNHEIELQEIEVVKTKNTTLVRELEQAGSNQAELLDLIASLQSKPPEIQYITRVETIIVGEPTVVTTELPAEHTFRTQEGLAVAQFLVEGENDVPEYIFDTADLTLRADIVLGSHDSALSLRVESDIEPGTELEIPVEDFSVKHIKDQRFFEPHITIGAQASVVASGTQLQSSLGPYVGSTLFHTDHIDMVQIRLGTSGGRAAIGVDPVLYNIGDRLPVLTNTWIGAGATLNTAGEWGGTISIGSKL